MFRAECWWPGGPKGTYSSRLERGRAVQSGLGMNKRFALSTHRVASRTLFSPVSVLVLTWPVGAQISLMLWV